MIAQRQFALVISLLCTSVWPLLGDPPVKFHAIDQAQPDPGQIEPSAGNWRTWVISSGRDYRVPPPPGAAATRAELRMLDDLISHANAGAQQQITYWDAGAPAYRWMDLINQRALAMQPLTANSTRVYLYVAQAMYDAWLRRLLGRPTRLV